MPRAPRRHEPNGIYHVTTHGLDDHPIFRDDLDRQWFVNHLSQVVRERAWRIFSVCLMGTHYHLLVQLSEADLPVGMHKLNGEYARAFNARHRRRGPVFEARYADTFVADDSHLRTAIRYIALNPIEAGLADRPEDWPWSTYAQALALRGRWPCFTPAFVVDLFGSADRLRAFVEDPKVPGTFGARHLSSRASRGRGR